MPDEASVDGAWSSDLAVIEAALGNCCSVHLASVEAPVASAVRYSLLGQGKRFRGLLVMAAFRAVGGRGDVGGLAASVEVVHAYSLVHDDLPCMDNDDLRRGRPTVHRAFGVPMATAAGVAMVPMAAACACSAAMDLGADLELAGAIVRELMRASGAGGMVGGQLLDLHAEGQALDLEALERIHRAKTGILISASVRIGAMAGRCTEPVLASLTAFGDALGLAYQIADDVLDVTATSDELGKTAGKDVAVSKSTYPALLGVDAARHRAGQLVREACDALRPAGVLTDGLERLAMHVVSRRS